MDCCDSCKPLSACKCGAMNIALAEFKDATFSTAKGRRLSIRTTRSAGSADTYTRILENHRPPTNHDLTSKERPGQTTRLSTDTMEHARFGSGATLGATVNGICQERGRIRTNA
ncbi:hypothetical protein VTO73DRAFT_5763 [Trametes versicolor]